MDELPGNPYYFEGSDEYWALEAKFKKKFDAKLEKFINSDNLNLIKDNYLF